MFNVTREIVIGQLKAAGSRDPDVLRGIADGLLATQKPMKLGSIGFMIIGAILTATIIGAIPGIPMLGIAIWVFLRSRSNTQTIESAYDEFVLSRGAPATA